MRVRILKSFLVLALLAGWAGFSATSHAATVTFESATLGPTGQTSGVGIFDGSYYGFGFSLAEDTQITGIGGHIYVPSGKSMWGAIVELTGGAGTFPTFAPSAIDGTVGGSVLAFENFTSPPTASSDDYLLSISKTLGPGDYALILGSFDALDIFGGAPATLANNNTVSGNPFLFLSSANQWGQGGQDVRLVVEGIAPVPVPAALPLFLSGLAGLGAVGWRRRKAAGGKAA